MIDKLPDPVILQLLKDAPQLGLVNKRLHGLAELSAHTRLLSYFNFENQEIEDLAADIRDHMQFESWQTAEDVARSDYWIFAPEHILEGKRGVYTLPGEPYGLQLTDWSNKTLEYTTRLRGGIYKVYLDSLIDSVTVLSNMQLKLLHSKNVKQNFSSSPSRRWLESQLQLKRGNRADGDGSMEPIKWKIGTIEVIPDADNEWVDFTIQMKIYPWDEPLTGIVLNYLKLEPTKAHVCDGEWLLHSELDRPSFGMAQVYRRASERKLRWSLRTQKKAVVT